MTMIPEDKSENHGLVESGSNQNEDETFPPITVTVKGIYTKRPKIGARKLPQQFKDSDLSKEQFMCRKRVYTKPMSMDMSMDINLGSSTDVSDESDDGSDLEEDGCDFETAYFTPGVGLAPFFWHNDQKKKPEEGKGTSMGYRAVLFQSTEHYQNLQENPQFKENFDGIDYMDSPSFGEQVIVQGCDATQLAIGDVFAVKGGRDVSPLVVEITSPRAPCFHVNKRHGTVMGAKGMQRHCLTHGLAGWFTSVLVPGELRDGMKLVRIKHPHPKWTLSYISKALYGDAPSKLNYTMGKAQWSGEKSELEEMIRLPQLAGYEWKDEAVKLLEKWNGEERKLGKRIEEPTNQSSSVVKKHGNAILIGALPVLFLLFERFHIGAILMVLGYLIAKTAKCNMIRKPI